MMATDSVEIRNQTSPCPIPDNSLSTLSIKITRKNQDRHWKLRFIYLQCYFLTIATILGTGILGLPVTIAHAGLVPFLFSFIVGFFVQALLIYLFVELLQKCQVMQLESLKTGVAECIVMDQVGVEDPVHTEEEDDDSENAEADTGLLQPDAAALHDQAGSLQPNLHLLGRIFLSRPMSHAFNCILLFQFISIGISYVLAGSEAYAALLNVSHIYVIPVFTWTLTLAILLAHTVIQPITSVLTLLKGILLIVTVAVTFAVGSEVGLQSSSDFSQMGKPFLMGTVALGGIVNVMPLLFSQISHNRTQILWFRRAVIGGLTTCTVLNILWCWAVLEIVPQTSFPERRMTPETTTRPDYSSPSGPPSSVSSQKYSNISLEESEKAGEIATIPLTKIINERYRAYSWVAELIQVFIAISVTVSFLVMGSAMKHTIDGLVSSLWSSKLEWLTKAWEPKLPNKQHICSARSVAKGFMSLLGFVVIFIVSVCDPRGFVVMLDKVVSFSLNTEVGLFVFIMLRECREDRFQQLAVPLPLGDCVFSLSWLLPTYFLFAVTYDVLQTLADLAHYLHFYNHDQEPHIYNLTGSLAAANLSTLL
ncbi:uncharacterized protein si:ch211-51h4.2 isoform X1 [Simochromis diagramma]|uniref:uncharacterized protein si:ch211-51h4.2 isoform X1 n=1 Tax=Haplochromis burtoni TaxID=8153 RepID=UPI0003BDB2C9|nr:uncharacterized protein si:ch211-51h4.2 isoform X1 [Haplochromis burtoni]XP_039895804.1 uncharacterized protein si:ch211-51h4.2 isoform X1 [Simochromis diagramma]XP_042083257.1 uncharacterized protein si:ch211-51h4.2 isoform X2 [Haplochromis burtoni]